jgi:hypothetical protein
MLFQSFRRVSSAPEFITLYRGLCGSVRRRTAMDIALRPCPGSGLGVQPCALP